MINILEYLFSKKSDLDKIKSVKRYPHRQRVTDWRQFEKEAYSYGNKTFEYYKYMCDFLIYSILWKYPGIEYIGTYEKDIKMGYSNTPAKIYTVKYEYNGHLLMFEFNNFFYEVFVNVKIDNKDITHDLGGNYIDMPIRSLLMDKAVIEKFKSLLNNLL